MTQAPSFAPVAGRWGSYLFPALGLAFCAANSLGAEIACVTTGCTVYAEYTFGGLSFWVWGTVAFAGLLLCAPLDRWRSGIFLAATSAVLLADLGFLVWQIVFLPCTSCMVAALLIGLSQVSAILAGGAPSPPRPLFRRLAWACLLAWTGLMLVDGVDAVRERARPWPIYGDPDTAHYAIWFSLNCPNCRETMQTILEAPGMMDDVVLYPLAKDADDLERFFVMFCGLRHDRELGDVLDESWETESCDVDELDLTRGEAATLRLRLAWNKALLVRRGHRVVPVLESSRLIVVDESTCDTGQVALDVGGDVPPWVNDDDPADAELCGDDLPQGCSIE